MTYIDSLFDYANKNNNSKTLSEQALCVLKFINSTDFNDPQTRNEAEAYIRGIVENKLSKNAAIGPIEARIMTALSAKLIMQEAGVDAEVEFVDDPRVQARALGGHKIQLNEGTFLSDDILKPDIQTGDSKRRKTIWAETNYVLAHETRHLVQYNQYQEFNQNPAFGTPVVYAYAKELAMRSIMHMESSGKYHNKIDPDRLYHQNHEAFIAEIDANLVGMKKGMDFTKRISPTIREQTKAEFDSRERLYETQMELAESRTWRHSTNVNETGVQASYKAAMVIDSGLGSIPKHLAQVYIKQFPVIALTHNPDGTRKPLEQVELERDEKLDLLLKSGTDAEIEGTASSITGLYETVIESDPILALEFSARHIASLSYESERYFAGGTKKHSPSAMRAELREHAAKMQVILGVIEDSNVKDVDRIIKKYEKIARQGIKANGVTARFYDEKCAAFGNLTRDFSKNKDVKKVRQEQLRSQRESMKSRKTESEQELVLDIPVTRVEKPSKEELDKVKKDSQPTRTQILQSPASRQTEVLAKSSETESSL